MNLDMQRVTSDAFGTMLEPTLQVPQQQQAQMSFGFQSMTTQQLPTRPATLPGPAQQVATTSNSEPLKQNASESTKTTSNQAMPDVLKNLVTPHTTETATTSPASKTETALLTLVDSKLCVSSPNLLTTFLKVLPHAKTEPEQALSLAVLRATATSSDKKLAQACATTFERSGGLKLARAWLENAVTWGHNELLVVLLEVLQTLPLQLTSITEARINEPIVKLRKGAREDKVKRAAQNLLKFWRGKFTEKDQKKSAPASTPAPAVKSKAKVSAVGLKPTTSSSASSSSSPPLVKEPKPIKKRTIKRLERLPYGGGSSVSKSSDLIGNLMQRKSAKEAAAAAEKKSLSTTNSASSSISGSNTEQEVKKDMSKASGELETSKAVKEDSSSSLKESPAIPLPTITSFKATASDVAPSRKRKRIRWADESGKELVRVKLIESWRDLVQHESQHDDQTFRAAKLREHADERHALLSHKQEHTVPPAVEAARMREWSTPALVRLPEPLAERVRRGAGQTDEVHVQKSRTRREIEYLVLNGEVPPPSPKEWERVGEPHRGAPVEIPLTDVADVGTNVAVASIAASTSMASAPVSVMDSSAASSTSAVTGGMPSNGYSRDGYSTSGPASSYEQRGYDQDSYNYEMETERELRAALGPLQKSTLALLQQHEDALPQVYDEAQRHGNQIPDARVVEIVEQHRRARFQASGPPPVGGMNQPFNKYGGQYGDMPSAGNYNMGPPAGYDDYHAGYQQGGGFAPGKRKADAMGMQPSMGPPSKRAPRNKGTKPCMYFGTPQGCKHGNNCNFSHLMGMPPADGMSGGADYIYPHGAPGPMMHGGRGAPGGRYGPSMGGMRGGRHGGRHIRGGR